MAQKLQIDGTVFLFWALGLLVLPLEWVTALLTGVIVHELWHYAMAYLLGIPVFRIRCSLGGCSMYTAPMEKGEEILVAMAGPMGSFSLLFLIRIWPVLGFCGLLQGLWNLIPLYPMDGGRILRCIAGERGYRHVSGAASVMHLVAGLFLVCKMKSPVLLILMIVNYLRRSGNMKNTLQTGGTRCTIEEPISKR